MISIFERAGQVMKNLAVIPARSGSKGLKDKNIKELKGKPLLAYSIDAAKESGLFSEIMVSTDSEKYAQTAKELGASVPFLRTKETSSDSAGSWDVVREVLKNYACMEKSFDSVCLLQPTSPLRTAEDICSGYGIMKEKRADAVVAVCEMDHSPLWSNTLPADFSMAGFIKAEVKGKPRQDLPVYYRVNGALYLWKVEVLIRELEIYSEKCYAYVMPGERSIDIDTEFDFKMAEFLMENLL